MGTDTAVLIGLAIAERLIVIAERHARRRIAQNKPEMAESIIDRLVRLRKELGHEQWENRP